MNLQDEIYKSCKQGDVDAVKYWLSDEPWNELSSEIRSLSATPTSAEIAEKKQEIAKLREEIYNGTNFACGGPLIYVASYHGHAHVVKALIDSRKIKLDNPQEEYSEWIDRKLIYYPLAMACFHGKTDVVRLLLQANNAKDRPPLHAININQNSYDYLSLPFSPLMLACMQNHVEVVRVLLEHGFDLNFNLAPDPDDLRRLGVSKELFILMLSHEKYRNVDRFSTILCSLFKDALTAQDVEFIALLYKNEWKTKEEKVENFKAACTKDNSLIVNILLKDPDIQSSDECKAAMIEYFQWACLNKSEAVKVLATHPQILDSAECDACIVPVDILVEKTMIELTDVAASFGHRQELNPPARRSQPFLE